MRRLALAVVLFSTAQARAADWFTVLGNSADPAVDSVELDLSDVAKRGEITKMEMRVNLAQRRGSANGDSYQSYQSTIAIDCAAEAITHVDQMRFEQRDLSGHGTFERFVESRPMAFRGLDPSPKARILKAACAPNH